MTITPRRIATLFILCLVVLLSAQATFGKGYVGRRVPNGVWGGGGIRMTVSRDGAEIEYDCGGGTIDAPLVLNRRGGFDVRGTHTRGHGGPIRLGEQPNTSAARYTGKMTGKVLTLTVKLAGANETAGIYTLRLGVEPRLHRCL
ncbi:MAG: hypothetical protein LC754_13230 [Acidobacteria bacterium]|nr:hypothetical protein [Acidobacteriota bacterium]